jgi:hypothetical protein
VLDLVGFTRLACLPELNVSSNTYTDLVNMLISNHQYSCCSQSFIYDHICKVVLAAPEHIAPAYKQHMVARHITPVRFFPEAFTKR